MLECLSVAILDRSTILCRTPQTDERQPQSPLDGCSFVTWPSVPAPWPMTGHDEPQANRTIEAQVVARPNRVREKVNSNSF